MSIRRLTLRLFLQGGSSKRGCPVLFSGKEETEGTEGRVGGGDGIISGKERTKERA